MIRSTVVVIASLLALSAPADAQDEWEGKAIRRVQGEGFRRQRFVNFKSLLNARPGQVYTLDKKIQDYRYLAKTRLFEDIKIDVAVVSGLLDVTITVKEFPFIDEVEFRGHTVYKTSELRAAVRLTAGGYLNPHFLKLDRTALTDLYIKKGYHFFQLTDELQFTPRGARLVWRIREGPLVGVEKIEFSGNESVDDSELKKYLLTKENSFLLFIPTGKNPFIASHLDEDLKRIKLYYKLEGWLDIYDEKPRPRVFVEEVLFNELKDGVRIRFRIDEGHRYKIRNIRIRGNRVFSEQEIRSWLVSRPGRFYTERNAGTDMQKIKDKYGERAYVLAQIQAEPLYVEKKSQELDLLFEIVENKKAFIGKIQVQGNTKTREEVIRRELTRKGFLPGEEYNTISLRRALNHLRNTGWFGQDPRDPQRGVASRSTPTDDPDSLDVTVDVSEGQTGNVRFAAGYSSAYGILGIIEFTQRNFDLADLPKSLSDFFNGTGFAGGGQFLRIRYAPSVKRQSFVVDFREPYFFGYEFGMGVQGYITSTQRESWDEERLGGSISFTKNLDPFRLELRFTTFQITLDSIDSDAPADVLALQGDHLLMSIQPSLLFDTRNNYLFPSKGARVALSFEYAGQILGGDFDYNKLVFDSDFFFTLHETEAGLKHVLSAQFTFGWAMPRRRATEVPIFERFFAGGRGSIRGFDYRGMGPHQAGDPIGGHAYAFASVEYSLPLFVEFIRVAAFYDVANLANNLRGLTSGSVWRQTVGFGFRFIVPQLSNIPIAIDFGFPLSYDDDDERETITFDIGRLF